MTPKKGERGASAPCPRPDSVNDPAIAEYASAADLSRYQLLAIAIGIAGTAIFILAGLSDPSQFFRAYLAAYLPCLNMGLGCMAILFVYHLTGGGWGYLIRRILEAGSRTLPLLAVGFLPIALGIKHLYLWADPVVVEGNELLRHQHVYMNPEFFWIRAAIYFGLWMTFAFFLNRWSRIEDRGGYPQIGSWLTNLSAGGAVIYGLTMHFSGVDWIISLQPSYHSTITGPMLASQQLLTSMAVVLMVFALLCRRPPLAELVSPKGMHDLGNLLLTFVVLFSYMLWFEFMLVWLANMRSDVVWYGNRLSGGWEWVAVSLMVFQFAIPFVLLLQRRVKRRPAVLARVAVLAWLMQVVFTHYQILPAFHPRVLADWWLSLVAAPGLIGLWAAAFLWQLKRAPILPLNDPNRAIAVHLRESDDWELQWEESLTHG